MGSEGRGAHDTGVCVGVFMSVKLSAGRKAEELLCLIFRPKQPSLNVIKCVHQVNPWDIEPDPEECCDLTQRCILPVFSASLFFLLHTSCLGEPMGLRTRP